MVARARPDAVRRVHLHGEEAGLTNVLAFTGGARVPSARFRVVQYVAPLKNLGVNIDIASARFGSYPPRSALARPAWAAATLASRIPAVIRSHRYDVSLLQREMLSTFQTLERFTGRPRVLDVDDALWLLPRGSFIAHIASRVDRVIAGNAYLADYFRKFCDDVEVLPTGVDADRFTPAPRADPAGAVVIGWSGSTAGHSALKSLAPALARVCKLRHVRVRVMSDRLPPLPELPPERVDFVKWSPEAEVRTLQSFDIGIMPLADGSWEKGKCSFKMLLYMACATPVVVAPVGMNAEVLSLDEVGRAAIAEKEWVDALIDLVDAPSTRAAMGERGRAVIEKHFSVRTLAPRLANLLGDSNA